jgi:hypothetical protein
MHTVKPDPVINAAEMISNTFVTRIERRKGHIHLIGHSHIVTHSVHGNLRK